MMVYGLRVPFTAYVNKRIMLISEELGKLNSHVR